MKKILVHLHLYYQDMWPDLKARIANIAPYQYDLYVTTTEENLDLYQDIKQFNADAHIQLVENRGYDIGPFIQVLNQVQLNDYDFVVKLHTKRDIPQGSILNGYNIGGSLWREYLLSFIQTKQNFAQCIQAFESRPKLGMCSHYRVIHNLNDMDGVIFHESSELLRKMNLSADAFKFVAGTIFMMRAELLAPLVGISVTINDFEYTSREQGLSLAHVYERLLGGLVTAQGYTIDDCVSGVTEQKANQLLKPLRAIGHFLYRNKVSTNGKRIIKICKIPVYRN